MRKPILCLDFDGVIHSYESGWKGADVIPDAPVPGAMAFITEAVEQFEVHIYSSRSGQSGGIDAMQDWLHEHMTAHFVHEVCGGKGELCTHDLAREALKVEAAIQWPNEKPPAMVSIDDRCLTFTGTWPQIDELRAFKPWNKGGVSEAVENTSVFYQTEVFPDQDDLSMIGWFSAVDGGYVGQDDTKEMLTSRGIVPQRRSQAHQTCSIGFCAKEQKWYGWSHRAMYGFGVGSSVAKGDCAYTPTDWDDLIEDAIRFWSGPGNLDVTGARSKDEDGLGCVKVEWTYCDDEKLVPNKKLHGEIRGATVYPPAEWGCGEWTAETLEDAKRMAMDFAEGVS